MREMKDSGIDIVKDIPFDWSVIRLKYLCDIQTGNQDTQDADDEGEFNFYVRSPIVERSTRYTFDGEGILMAGDGAGAGRIFHHAFGKYAVHQRVYRLANFKSINSYFLFYYLSNLFNVEMDKGSAQSTVPSVRLPMLLNFGICIPSPDEQNRIADYLESKCNELATLISDIQSQIEILEEYKRSVITEAVTKGLDHDVEMRDSGVDYIGKKNTKWKLTKLRYICEKLNRYFDSDAEPLICSNKGEVFPRGDSSIGLVSDNDKMFQGVHKGDLLIHGMDTWHGAIAVSDYDGKCTTVVHVCDSEQNKYFICYFLQMLAFKSVYKAISNGVRENTSDFRSWDKAGHIYIAIPDIDEQNRIAEYIKEKVEHINAVIAEKKQQIETIEEYKKSLIFEYVTGKKEVTQ